MIESKQSLKTSAPVPERVTPPPAVTKPSQEVMPVIKVNLPPEPLKRSSKKIQIPRPPKESVRQQIVPIPKDLEFEISQQSLQEIVNELPFS